MCIRDSLYGPPEYSELYMGWYQTGPARMDRRYPPRGIDGFICFRTESLYSNSLDFIRDTTPADQWMNEIPAYSMWWLLIHKEWYLHTGDLAYLQGQRGYMKQMAEHIGSFVQDNGDDTIADYFLDWPSSSDPSACKIGVRALLVMALEAAALMLNAMVEEETAPKCQRWACLLYTSRCV